ncbi:hypothetical protein D3C81_1298980 [compost metagenome]|jgi:hypothetical protein
MENERIETRGEDGRRVLVFKFWPHFDATILPGTSLVEGLPRYALANGNSVTFNGVDFEIAATGEELVRSLAIGRPSSG